MKAEADCKEAGGPPTQLMDTVKTHLSHPDHGFPQVMIPNEGSTPHTSTHIHQDCISETSGVEDGGG